jgi:hypothetical protein
LPQAATGPVSGARKPILITYPAAKAAFGRSEAVAAEPTATAVAPRSFRRVRRFLRNLVITSFPPWRRLAPRSERGPDIPSELRLESGGPKLNQNCCLMTPTKKRFAPRVFDTDQFGRRFLDFSGPTKRAQRRILMSAWGHTPTFDTSLCNVL